MPKLERLTSWDRKFLSALHLTMDAAPTGADQLADALMDSMGRPRSEEERLQLSSRNAMLGRINEDLRQNLLRAIRERDSYRTRFLLALTTAVGLAAGLVITVITLWWLMAGKG